MKTHPASCIGAIISILVIDLAQASSAQDFSSAGAVNNERTSEMDHQPFVTALTAEPSYRLGDAILITFEIENTGSETYQLLTWGTPLEGQFTVDCLTVRRDGELVPYDGRLVKRGDPPPEAYVVIRPGERLKKTVDISHTYAIDQAGDYTVTLNASFFDAFPVPGNAKQAPRKRQAHESHKLPPAAAQFKVVAGGEAKLTAGQAARKASLGIPSSHTSTSP
jgi:hypothetical protein